MIFREAFLIAVVAFFAKIKYINADFVQIYTALEDLYIIIEKEYNTYYSDQNTVDLDLHVEYFTKNFSTIGKKYADKFIQNKFRGIK